MSVKDKIAMWNNMSNSGGSQPTAVKPIIQKPKPVYPPRQEVAEKPIATGGSGVDTTSILTPSMLKKRMQEQSSGQEKLPAFLSNNNPSPPTPVKPFPKQVNPNPNSVVPKPLIQSQPVAKHQHEQPAVHLPQKQPQNIETFSERKKRLQQQIQKNQLHLGVPFQIKKVESITVEREGPEPQVIIEKDIPTVGVKERAQQLSQFYHNKKQEEHQQANSLNITPVLHEQPPQPDHKENLIPNTSNQPKPQISHEPVPHVEPAILHQQAPKETHQQPSQPAQQWDYNSEESSLAMVQQGQNTNEPQSDEANELMVRLKNKRNQQKRRLFESDED